MTHHPAPADRFIYEGYSLDAERAQLTCRYEVAGRHFTERVTFDPGGDWTSRAVDAAARLVFLLAGISYFKTAAPPLIDLGTTVTTESERAFLSSFYRRGLGEFAYDNHLDLSELEFVGPELSAPELGGPELGTPELGAPADGPGASSPGTDALAGGPHRPLIPFGGGIDSIVTVAAIGSQVPDAALFIMNRPGDRFAAIEEPARVTGLPVVRAEREIDPQLFDSAELGFLNGHVPITGILSAIAVLAAVLAGRDAVVMSNEWSASIGNLTVDGEVVNHQWSKGLEFETGFAHLLDHGPLSDIAYFSFLRPFSELWVADRFSRLTEYHSTFRSCNRAFRLDRTRRLDHWCGECDKCCFIDLILAPFLEPAALRRIFGGREPLEDPALTSRFATLLGLSPDAKPFECVGDVDECRAAVELAARRPDRAASVGLSTLLSAMDDVRVTRTPIENLMAPLGPHFIPERYVPAPSPAEKNRPRGTSPHDQLV